MLYNSDRIIVVLKPDNTSYKRDYDNSILTNNYLFAISISAYMMSLYSYKVSNNWGNTIGAVLHLNIFSYGIAIRNLLIMDIDEMNGDCRGFIFKIAYVSAIRIG